MSDDIKKIPALSPDQRAEILAKQSAEDPAWAHCEECGLTLRKSDSRCKLGDNFSFCPAFRK
jgi:hypothetical protein